MFEQKMLSLSEPLGSLEIRDEQKKHLRERERERERERYRERERETERERERERERYRELQPDSQEHTR